MVKNMNSELEPKEYFMVFILYFICRAYVEISFY